MVVAISGIYVGRLAWQLGFIFHRNPIAALGDVLGSGSGSSVGQKVSTQQRINIALYGYGGSGHDGAYLTDSIMVLSIQPLANGKAQVAEISVPRDWYVPIDLGNGHHYYGRVNEAYSDGQTDSYPNRADQYKGEFGGGALADATLGKLLGIHIDHFVGIDFHAFQYAVDAVGGVDVVVPHTFTDYSYPAGECDQGNCALETVHFDAGRQHMDGKTALIFSRSRHSNDNGEGGDFARSRRQQLILQALKDRIVSVNGIAKLPDVLGALGSHVITDMGIGDAKQLYALVKDVSPASIARVSIDDSNFLYECGYPTNCPAAYLYAHDTTYQSVSHFVQSVFPPTAVLADGVPVTVEDGSGRGMGASGRWSSLLGDLHFKTTDGGSTRNSATTHVILNGGGPQGAQTAQYLATYFGVAVENATPAASGTAGGAASSGTAGGATSSASAQSTAAAGPSVTLILGADEERSFNHDTGVYGGLTGTTYTHSTTTTTTRRTTTSSTTATTTTSTTSSSTTSTGILPTPPLGTPTPKPRGQPTPTPTPAPAP